MAPGHHTLTALMKKEKIFTFLFWQFVLGESIESFDVEHNYYYHLYATHT